MFTAWPAQAVLALLTGAGTKASITAHWLEFLLAGSAAWEMALPLPVDNAPDAAPALAVKPLVASVGADIPLPSAGICNCQHRLAAPAALPDNAVQSGDAVLQNVRAIMPCLETVHANAHYATVACVHDRVTHSARREWFTAPIAIIRRVTAWRKSPGEFSGIRNSADHALSFRA